MNWITREGKKMKVSEMSDSHLINSINMVKRKLAEDPGVYGDEDSFSPVGQAIESENRRNDEIREYLNDALAGLNKEKEKRGI